MKVVRSEVLGFCMGVQRAVTLASDEADNVKEKGGRVFTLGPLIHNPNVLSNLKNRGVEILDKPPQNPEGCSIVIRAHGIDPRIEKDLRGRGAYIVDATCPKVKESQLKAEALLRDGYSLFLAGEAEHAEIQGIQGFAESGFYSTAKESSAPFCVVAGNAAEAEKAAKKLREAQMAAGLSHGKTALIGQTTISMEEYLTIGEAVKKYFPNLMIIQTICSATAERQQALRELLDQVDAVIVAGGRDSANTRRLLAIAQESGKPCALIESAGEIPAVFLSCRTIGLCAGASTPDSVIDEIERELMR